MGIKKEKYQKMSLKKLKLELFLTKALKTMETEEYYFISTMVGISLFSILFHGLSIATITNVFIIHVLYWFLFYPKHRKFNKSDENIIEYSEEIDLIESIIQKKSEV
jgi:hypothetical protein